MRPLARIASAFMPPRLTVLPPPVDIKVWVHQHTVTRNGSTVTVPACWADRKSLYLGNEVWRVLFEATPPEYSELKDYDYDDAEILVLKGPKPFYPEAGIHVHLLQSNYDGVFDVYVDNQKVWENVPGYWREGKFEIRKYVKR